MPSMKWSLSLLCKPQNASIQLLLEFLGVLSGWDFKGPNRFMRHGHICPRVKLRLTSIPRDSEMRSQVASITVHLVPIFTRR